MQSKRAYLGGRSPLSVQGQSILTSPVAPLPGWGGQQRATAAFNTRMEPDSAAKEQLLDATAASPRHGRPACTVIATGDAGDRDSSRGAAVDAPPHTPQG